MLLEAKSSSEKLGGLAGWWGSGGGLLPQLGNGVGAQAGLGPGQHPALCPSRLLPQLS